MNLRLLAMSNIHGHFDEMMALLSHVNYNPENDKLFILGGLTDYGPKSIEVIEKCMELQNQGAVILRGEREQLYINAFAFGHFPSEEKLCKTKNTLVYYYHDHLEIMRKHIDFFKQLPFYAEYENYIFSHAGMDINHKDNYAYCLANRSFYATSDELEKTDKTFVFGYMPVFIINKGKGLTLFKKPHLLGIDFGAGRYAVGSLGIVILEPEQRYLTIKIA